MPSHIVTSSFYGKSKGYLNPLERKEINSVKGLSASEVIPSKKTPPKKVSPKLKKVSPKLKTRKGTEAKSSSAKSPHATVKLSNDAISEIVLYKTNKPSPSKNINRKFFRKRSPTKSPRKAKMTLDMGRSLQLKFSNVRRSPRKMNRPTSVTNMPAPLVTDNDFEMEKQEPFFVENEIDFENKLNLNVENTKPKNPVDIEVSDAESGFSEDGSSTFSVTDTPPRPKILTSNNMTPSPKRTRSPKVKSTQSPQSTSKARKGNLEQLAIDAGQREFGAVRCKTCNMVYTTRDPHDEIAHSKFHNKFVNTLRFPGWKKEELIGDFYDGRIIRVLPNMPKHQLQKVEELRQLLDTNLGFPNVGLMNPSETHFYLFIATGLKKIVGCVIAEPITKAYRVFQDPQVAKGNIWCRAETPVPAVCGISRVWVVSSHRRKKIASRLIDTIALNFAYGSVIRKEQIAFSDPTPDGREFISSYAGTSSFLVYGGY